jgi:outer membrane protein OmpA-like peptidoglycan-associated protein
MIFRIQNSKRAVFWAVLCVMLAAFLANNLAANPPQITSGEKAKVKGSIVSRNGDLIKVKDKKTGSIVIVSLVDGTKIERKKGKVEFFRHSDMDVTAMVPGLTIDAEGVGNAQGQLEAKKITFIPDAFAIEVAEEQQIMANKAAAANAQSTANQGVQQAKVAQASAKTAQTSANKAQASANTAGSEAQAAGAAAEMDAAAVLLVNKRVSDLDDYKVVAEAGIYFPADNATLDAPAKADLDMVAAATQGVTGYMIEVAGYASTTGTKQVNQKLSEERASAVTKYLLEQKNIPMRRILVPAGYGATHPAAENSDPQGRALNRRVDVKVLVNKGLAETM